MIDDTSLSELNMIKSEIGVILNELERKFLETLSSLKCIVNNETIDHSCDFCGLDDRKISMIKVCDICSERHNL
jgi:hypothetical protein